MKLYRYVHGKLKIYTLNKGTVLKEMGNGLLYADLKDFKVWPIYGFKTLNEAKKERLAWLRRVLDASKWYIKVHKPILKHHESVISKTSKEIEKLRSKK